MDAEYRITRGERREEKRACKRRDHNYPLAAAREARRQAERSRRRARKEKEGWTH